MTMPDWYPEWRHDAIHELQDKNARLKDDFNLGRWTRYDYELETGELRFSENGIVKVVARIQIAGSTSVKGGNWLWAWGNSHWPAPMVTDTQDVRAFGEKHGIADLTEAYVRDDEDLNALGWELTAVAVRICGALGAYRPPRDEGGALFLIYKSMTWAS